MVSAAPVATRSAASEARRALQAERRAADEELLASRAAVAASRVARPGARRGRVPARARRGITDVVHAADERSPSERLAPRSGRGSVCRPQLLALASRLCRPRRPRHAARRAARRPAGRPTPTARSTTGAPAALAGDAKPSELSTATRAPVDGMTAQQAGRPRLRRFVVGRRDGVGPDGRDAAARSGWRSRSSPPTRSRRSRTQRRQRSSCSSAPPPAPRTSRFRSRSASPTLLAIVVALIPADGARLRDLGRRVHRREGQPRQGAEPRRRGGPPDRLHPHGGGVRRSRRARADLGRQRRCAATS